MEYVDRATVADLLEDRGQLSWEDVAEIGVQVSQALHHAHQADIVHRDLKPANLLRTTDGIVKLSDFGVAKLIGDTSTTAANTLVGTADYASPEQAANKPVTNSDDLYAGLGVVFYQLLTGRLPFMAETAVDMLHQHRYGRFDAPSRLAHDLPHEMDSLVLSLMEKDPDKRPANAAEVEKTLPELTGQNGTQATVHFGWRDRGDAGRMPPPPHGQGLAIC